MVLNYFILFLNFFNIYNTLWRGILTLKYKNTIKLKKKKNYLKKTKKV